MSKRAVADKVQKATDARWRPSMSDTSSDMDNKPARDTYQEAARAMVEGLGVAGAGERV